MNVSYIVDELLNNRCVDSKLLLCIVCICIGEL